MKQQFAAKHPWTILAAGAAIQILTGLPAAWGVFQQPVMDEFSLTEDGAGYAFGILIAAFGVGCVIGGFLQDKKGPRCAALWGTGLLCGGFFAAALLPGEKAENRGKAPGYFPQQRRPLGPDKAAGTARLGLPRGGRGFTFLA